MASGHFGLRIMRTFGPETFPIAVDTYRLAAGNHEKFPIKTIT